MNPTPKIISRNKVQHMRHHILEGFISSQKGITSLYEQQLVTLKEYHHLLSQNLERFEARLQEWCKAENMLSIAFAFLFSFMAFTSTDGDLYRRARRTRRTRRSRQEQTLKH